MTQQITGSVVNGDRAVATFPFYQGVVGIRERAGSDLLEVAYRADAVLGGRSLRGRRTVDAERLTVASIQLPARGQLDGQAVDILSVEPSTTARNMMVAIVRPAA